MKVAIIGYGKMGKAIEAVLHKRGHSVTHRLRRSDEWCAADLKAADVAIEFTQPDAAVKNLLECIAAGIPVVTGTTGWLADLPAIEKAVAANNAGVFYASNFSIGVNVYNSIIRAAARKLSHLPEYKLDVHEIHHTEKKDAPSGTAITLAETLIEAHEGYDEWLLNGDGNQEGVIPVTAARQGGVHGTHEITFTSAIDRIKLTHEAFSREGFAQGAVSAAEWMLERKGLFNMNDLLNLNEE